MPNKCSFTDAGAGRNPDERSGNGTGMRAARRGSSEMLVGAGMRMRSGGGDGQRLDSAAFGGVSLGDTGEIGREGEDGVEGNGERVRLAG